MGLQDDGESCGVCMQFCVIPTISGVYVCVCINVWSATSVVLCAPYLQSPALEPGRPAD